jgi:hypothetical protein
MQNTKTKILGTVLSRMWSSRGNLYRQRDRRMLVGELIYTADRAITSRDGETLKQVADTLGVLDLPQSYEAIVQYYQAMVSGPFDAASGDLTRRRIDELCSHGPMRIQARALIAAGVASIRRGRLDDFAYATKEANRLILLDSDHLGLIFSTMNAAVVLSRQGNHPESLRLLENIFPLMRQVAGDYPGQYAQYMNSLAIECAEVGDTARAETLIKRVARTPYVGRFPEFLDTEDDIRRSCLSASRSQVFTGAVAVKDNHRRLAKRSPAAPPAPTLSTSARVLPFKLRPQPRPSAVFSFAEKQVALVEFVTLDTTPEAALDRLLAVAEEFR